MARVPDSLTQVFRTRNGREVRDGGGIIPDYVIPQEKSGTIGYYLLADNIIFNFVTEWAMKHPTVDAPESFQLSDADYEEFKQYVKGRDFQYDQMSNRSLQSLKEIMEFEGYFSNASEEFNALKKKLQPDLDRDLELFGKEIRKMIETEIMQRYYYKEGVLMYELRDDPVLKKAREVLKNRELYDRTLQPQPERA